eukprot:5646617-Prymnesium_polylepis.1
MPLLENGVKSSMEVRRARGGHAAGAATVVVMVVLTSAVRGVGGRGVTHAKRTDARESRHRLLPPPPPSSAFPIPSPSPLRPFTPPSSVRAAGRAPPRHRLLRCR